MVTVGLLICALAQNPTAVAPAVPAPSAEQLPAERVPVSLDRIKRGLAAPREEQLDVSAAATFRVEVEARPIRLDVPWKDDSTAPYYVRTPRTLYHHEFLSMVTPEAFRSGVLYPIGFNVLSVLPEIRRAIREAREAAARAAVEAELREFERQRATRPPP